MAARIEAADGFARVFPEHKYAIVKALQERGLIVGMTGDGVNDAPALKQADIGVAVSGATDAARAAAALILTAPGLSTIIRGIEEARRIFERMMSYTLYRIAMTLDIMVFIVLATIVYGFFPLTPIMIIMLALLDDVPIMTIAFDNAKVPSLPVRWQMDRVLVVSSILGLLAVVQSFGLLAIGQNVLHLDAPHLQTALFLQLVVGGHLMLFVTRTKGPFWMPDFPAAPLFLAIVATQVLAALLCAFGILVPAIPWWLIGLVWVYNIVWMFLQDLAKLVMQREFTERAAKSTAFLARLKEPLQGAKNRLGSAGAAGRGAVSRWGAADNVAAVLGIAALLLLIGAGDWYWRHEGVAVAKAAPLAGQTKTEPEASGAEAPAKSVTAAPAPAPLAAPKEETAAAAPATQAKPRAEAAAPEGTPRKTVVEVGALPSQAQAVRELRALKARKADLLKNHEPVVARSVRDGRTLWVLDIGGFGGEAEALDFCQQLRNGGAQCELVIVE